MSLFSIIGIIVFVAVLIAGIAVKIYLHYKRNQMDGCSGIIEEETAEKNQTDDWDRIS